MSLSLKDYPSKDKVLVYLYFILFFYTFFFQNRIKEINGFIVANIIVILLYQVLVLNHGKIVVNNLSNPLLLFVLSTILMCIFGLFGSPSKNEHLITAIKVLEYMAIMLSIVSFIHTRRDYNTVVFILAVVILMICIVFALSPQPYRGNIIDGRYSFGINMNPNGLGFLINLGQWCVIYLLINNSIKLLPSILIQLLDMYCVFLTGSRKAFLTAITIIVLFVILCGFRYIRRMKTWHKLAVFAGLPILIVLGYRFLLSQYLSSSLVTRMTMLSKEIGEGERHQLYTFGWDLFKNNFLLGVGFNGFQFYQGIEYSHSTVIESLVIGGIIPFILYWCSYIFSYIEIRRIEKRNSEMQLHSRTGIVLIVLIILTGLGTSHITSFDGYIAFALLFSLLNLLKTEVMCDVNV